MKDCGLCSSIECQHQGKAGAEFADGEDGDERKRIHAADEGLAIREIHGPPHKARAGCGKNATDCMAGVSAAAIDGAKAEHDSSYDNGRGSHHDLDDIFCAGAFDLSEEEPAPKNAYQ